MYWYAIQDWIMGLLSVDGTSASNLWTGIQRRGVIDTLFPKQSIHYIRKDGREYEIDHTTDFGLYIITQNLRVTKERTLLKQIKLFLADSGVFVDLVRREPEKIIETITADPDKALDAVIKMYQREGKSDEWILMRINTKIQRAAFTSALKAAMADTTQTQYGKATNEIYLGLWERTAKMLKQEMDLPKSANLRDHQPIAALYYQGLAEDGCARELGERQELTWGEALHIVQDVSQFIGGQARAYGERFGVDLATGKQLLRDKN